MIKNSLMLFLVLLLARQSFGQKEILVYTHNGKGFVHDNISASVEALQKIAREAGYKLQVSEDPEIFSSENLKHLDLIIFSNTNNEAFYTSAQREAFVEYINRGGAFVGIHISSGSERNWPWFAEMQGGKFVSHPAIQTFEIKVINAEHPATDFMDPVWTWEDECYYFTELNPAINILLAADLRTIEDPNKDSFPGKTFGNYTPLAWYHTFGKSRVFYTALGHKIEHYQNPLLIRHIMGGIKWALNEN